MTKLLTAAFLLLSTQDAVKLEYSYKKGVTTKYDFQMTQGLTMGAEDRRMETSMHFVIRRLIQDVGADKTATCKMNYDRVKFSVKGPIEMGFDSDNKEDLERAKDDPTLGALAALVTRSMTLKLKPTGEAFDLDAKELLDGIPNAEMAKKMMDSMNAFNAGLPDKSVKKGDTWMVHHQMDLGLMKMEMDMTSTLKDIAGSTAKIEMAIKVAMKFNDPGVQVKITDQNNTGWLHFDMEAGDVLEMGIDQKFGMEVDAGGESGKMSISQKIRMKPLR